MSDDKVMEPSEESIGVAARCWCDPETSMIEMDTRLAMAFAKRYEALKAENAELKAKLAVAVEALEIYADESNHTEGHGIVHCNQELYAERALAEIRGEK